MRILLVEPSYYTKYPPLGLLKLGKLEERKWNEVKLVNGTSQLDFVPDKIYITSLFTYSWKPVHEAIEFYHRQFPAAEINVGGIYATLMPQNIRKEYPFVKIHMGLVKEAEEMIPAYGLLPKGSSLRKLSEYFSNTEQKKLTDDYDSKEDMACEDAGYCHV